MRIVQNYRATFTGHSLGGALAALAAARTAKQVIESCSDATSCLISLRVQRSRPGPIAGLPDHVMQTLRTSLIITARKYG
ncbi:hypothetical protein ANCCAN_15101 [Ancylostoma caninum]|uniref:Fungal lipase-type domain-containing protein n=1 Tax=Ancylostoma caninum TaxID=29170 RepID=A0A368G7K5_ANCCA|nr:hypothetical protein ANCCAN_15101 [Ancylostoma caninum]